MLTENLWVQMITMVVTTSVTQRACACLESVVTEVCLCLYAYQSEPSVTAGCCSVVALAKL